ncbi:hypothetical protein ACLQ2Y_29205 [Micromonospora echinospora]|uniref:hypothetical protein n=1 Tax=Micromonospora echinospora TaxID=1877 RepID=UPI003CFA176C
MDFVELVIDGSVSVDRDDIEDALNEALAGQGEVTGAGTSQAGSHLDVEIDQLVDRLVVLEKVFLVLEQLQVGDAVRVRPGDGENWLRLSQWRAGKV